MRRIEPAAEAAGFAFYAGRPDRFYDPYVENLFGNDVITDLRHAHNARWLAKEMDRGSSMIDYGIDLKRPRAKSGIRDGVRDARAIPEAVRGARLPLGSSLSKRVQDFVEVAGDVFGFLEDDYGCVREPLGGQGPTGAEVTFKNWTTFVSIYLEPRDCQVIVYLGPVRDEKVPPGGGDWFDLEFVLFARGIPLPSDGGRLGEISGVAARRRELEEYAEALRLGADDVLKGDFEVFTLVKAIMDERRKFMWHPAVKRGRLL